ncbi:MULTISPECIES: hypothetical protein [unclassified Bacillus cereus group]|uniref:hypothetical protein n=1 Tax=unclassified Bacillus cereus group TaxID=2750818 RepID=UPI003396DAB4
MLKKQEILAVYQKGPEAICDFIHQLEHQIQNLKGHIGLTIHAHQLKTFYYPQVQKNVILS